MSVNENSRGIAFKPRSSWLAAAVLVAVVFAAYGNSLRGPFVYDDVPAISDNPTIRHLWPLSGVLLPHVDGGITVSGRPVLNLSFALNHAVSGDAVWSYHALNIIIHAGAALMLFGLMRCTLMLPGWRVRFGTAAVPLAFAVAALWAVHPLQTQAVTYTVQRAESLMGFFYFFTLYAFVRGVVCHPLDDNGEVQVTSVRPEVCHLMDDNRLGRTRGCWMTISVVACALGMATKEVMATAPLMVFLYDRTFVAGSFRAAWRERRGFYFMLAGTWLLLGALVLSTGGNRGGTVGLGVGVPWWAYGLTQFRAIAHYLQLSVWPHPLVFEYGTLWTQRAGDIVPYAAIVLPLLAATLVALRRWPAVGFLGAWFFGILAPTSLTPGTIQMIVEHRMYLPLAAVVAGVVFALYRCAGRRTFVAFAFVAFVLAGLTFARNHDYGSHLALWGDTVAKRPDNPHAREGLGEAFAEAGRLDDAIAQQEECVRLKPDESTYHYNLALLLARAGRLDEAIRSYEFSLRLNPGEPRVHNNLAVALVQAGQLVAALPHYAEAERLQPSDAQTHYNHGIALFRLGRFSEAIEQYKTALRLRPDDASSQLNLGTALMSAGQLDEALAHYAAALQLQPGDADTGTALGGALLVAGRVTEALKQFRAVLAAHPEAIEARYGLGNALGAAGQLDAAVATYEEVLKRAPGHANTHFKLANLLLDGGRVADALVHYEAAIRLNPNDAESHHNLGIAYARLERYGEARREFETALRLKPDYADAQRDLAQLRAVLGLP